MELYEKWKEILKIQKFRRIASYTGFYCFAALISYAYTNNTTRAGISRADQYYASYPAGTELLTDTAKLYKAALGNCFEIEEWGPIEYSVMAKHFDRQGKPPYAYHAIGTAQILKQSNGSDVVLGVAARRTGNHLISFPTVWEICMVVQKQGIESLNV